MHRFALAALMLLVLVTSSFAQSRKEQRQMRKAQRDGWSQGWTEVAGSSTVMVAPPVQAAPPAADGPPPVSPNTKPAEKNNYAGSDDALDEVNAKRATMGLRPFINDPLLTQAALACAKERARTHQHGHLYSDFAYLPQGGKASAAGCGALEDSWGWGTCCYTENYTYAGAAWVRGSDNLRYMHIFVR